MSVPAVATDPISAKKLSSADRSPQPAATKALPHQKPRFSPVHTLGEEDSSAGEVRRNGPYKNRPPLPITSPTKPFDRVALAATRSEIDVTEDDDRYALDRPLPQGFVAAEKFASLIVRQAVEVLLGHRPARQLQTWMTSCVFNALVRRVGLAHRVAGKAERCLTPQVRRVHVCHPRTRVAEVTLVIFDGRRIRAAATRLEVRHGRWHVTALEII